MVADNTGSPYVLRTQREAVKNRAFLNQYLDKKIAHQFNYLGIYLPFSVRMVKVWIPRTNRLLRCRRGSHPTITEHSPDGVTYSLPWLIVQHSHRRTEYSISGH